MLDKTINSCTLTKTKSCVPTTEIVSFTNKVPYLKQVHCWKYLGISIKSNIITISVDRSSQRRCSIKKAAFKFFSKFIGKQLRWSLFLNKAPLILLKKPDTGVFLWILRNFQEHLFYRPPHGNCYCVELDRGMQYWVLTYWVLIWRGQEWSTTQVHELPQSHCGENREGTLFTLFPWLHIYIVYDCKYIYIYIYLNLKFCRFKYIYMNHGFLDIQAIYRV